MRPVALLASAALRAIPFQRLLGEEISITVKMSWDNVNPFLDTRGDLRVHNFTGLDTDWDAFKIKFEAYTDLLGMSDFMDEAEHQLLPIDNGTLSTLDALNCLKALYALPYCEVRGESLRHCDTAAKLARA